MDVFKLLIVVCFLRIRLDSLTLRIFGVWHFETLTYQITMSFIKSTHSQI